MLLVIGGTHSASVDGATEAFGRRRLAQYTRLFSADPRAIQILPWDGGIPCIIGATGAVTPRHDGVLRSIPHVQAALRSHPRVAVIGYSHGGNIALEALAHALETVSWCNDVWLITLATPALGRYVHAAKRVRRQLGRVTWLNLWHRHDRVQRRWAGIEDLLPSPWTYETGAEEIELRLRTPRLEWNTHGPRVCTQIHAAIPRSSETYAAVVRRVPAPVPAELY